MMIFLWYFGAVWRIYFSFGTRQVASLRRFLSFYWSANGYGICSITTGQNIGTSVQSYLTCSSIFQFESTYDPGFRLPVADNWLGRIISYFENLLTQWRARRYLILILMMGWRITASGSWQRKEYPTHHLAIIWKHLCPCVTENTISLAQ
jgi:hypothetical protein